MEINDFKDIDICTIIKTCAKSGVTKLEMGLLKIDFQKSDFLEVPAFVKPSQIVPLEVTPEDKEFLSELEETQTMMDDPDQWEQNMIDSFIEKDIGAIDARSRRNEVESTL